MFKIEESTIHCSRGDGGIIRLRIPFIDAKGYIKYEDNSRNVYWYDSKNRILYDNDYKKSSVALDTLIAMYYQFTIGDIIKLNIYKKNGYTEEPLKTIIIKITEDSYYVDISLSESDTTFGEISNKAVVYWYDITLNDNQTVVCFNEDGAKEFIQYPAKGDDE